MTEERSRPVREFLNAYAALCREHGLCFRHEDEHGAFLVVPYREGDENWACGAFDRTGEAGPGGPVRLP